MDRLGKVLLYAALAVMALAFVVESRSVLQPVGAAERGRDHCRDCPPW
ncbi:MAG: hypothetical protein U0670_12070 [Anaerolineae bacterium]